MQRYVISGQPGVGKTAVIQRLAKLGYTVLPEVARELITYEQESGGDLLPERNLTKFQVRVTERQLEQEDALTAEEVFLDRSLIDGWAYCVLAKIKPPPLIAAQAPGRYHRVFILDPLPFYLNDRVRNESLAEARAIHRAIWQAYQNFGYQPIKVPFLDRERRVDYILDKL